MVKFRGTLLTMAVTSLVVGAVPVSAGANILVNPGFETGDLFPWLQIRDFGGPEDWNVTASEAHSGVYSATAVGNKLLGQFFDPIPTDDITEISFWAKQPESVVVGTHYFYSNNTDEQGSVLYLLGTGWEFFDVTSEVAPNRELIGFAV